MMCTDHDSFWATLSFECTGMIKCTFRHTFTCLENGRKIAILDLLTNVIGILKTVYSVYFIILAMSVPNH